MAVARLSFAIAVIIVNFILTTETYASLNVPMSTLEFTPNPGVFYRCSHCPPPDSLGLEQPTPLSIAQLLLTSVPVQSNPPSVQLANTTQVRNLQVKIFPIQFPVVPRPGTNEATPCPSSNSNCVYVVDFFLTKLPTVGFTNQYVLVNVGQSGNLVGNVVVNLNFNCNPIWQSVSANIGPTPSLVSFTSLLRGREITYVKVPKLTVSPIASARNANVQASYAVHYSIPKGVGEATPASLPNGALMGPKKVYVNCAAGAIGGNTVVAVVSATDPAGGPVSYFAYSSVTERGIAGPGRELHTITSAGVLSMSGTADVTGVPDQNYSDGSVGGDGNGGTAGTYLAPPNSPNLPKDVYMVALTSAGCSSVLQARFYLACGEVV